MMPSEKTKAAESVLVAAYDVEEMTENELITYVEALEEEQERMEKARSLYSKDKNELLNVLKSVQDDIFKAELVSMPESQKIQVEDERDLELEDEFYKIQELEHISAEEKNNLQTFLHLRTVETLNREEETDLKKGIAERETDIQHLKYTFELMMVHSKENSFTKYHESSKHFVEYFENFVAKYNDNYLKMLEEFSRDNMKQLQDILGDLLTEAGSSFIDSIATMTEYFTDIFWKNRQAEEELLQTLFDVKKKLHTVTLKLRDATKDNSELANHINRFRCNSYDVVQTSPPYGQAEKNAIEELTCDNYSLSLKLQWLNKEFSDLKAKFLAALRKVYLTADFKDLVKERRLSAEQNRDRS